MIARPRVGIAAAVAVLVLAACGIATTGVATDVGDTSVTLTGTADNSEPGNITYWFEYGTTTTYGSSTDHRTTDITAPIPVSAVVEGLDPHLTYHYRLCVHDNGDNRGGCGKDLTFSTTGNVALRVNNTGDLPDSQPGNGVCQDQGAAAGRCSLRAAVQEANARAGSDTVIVQSGLGVISLTRGELLVTSALTLRGNGATIDARSASRVLDVTSGSLRLERATLTHGRAATGGGLLVASGTSATVVDSTVTANESTGLYQCRDYYSGVSPPVTVDCSGVGGGAGIFSDGILQVARSTISANHAVGGGCVSETVGGPGTVTTCTWSQGAGIHSAGGTVTDSTITGNRSDRGAGAGLTAVRGAVAVTRATVADNLGDSQLDVCCTAQDKGFERALSLDGSITARGSIVVGLQPVCGHTAGISSQDFNLASDASCHFAQPADRQGISPVLNPLAANGGPTQTRLPFANSPAVDAIPGGTPALCDGATPHDQRGVPRPAGPACDIGAVEGDSGTNASPLVLFVNHGGDDTDAAPGDGVCQDASGAAGRCSLRAAVAETNARPGPDAIVIVPGVNVTLTRGFSTPGSDVGDLDVTDALAIDGSGAVIDAAGIDGVINVVDADLTLADATLTGGVASGLQFIADNEPHELHVRDVTVRGNSAAQGGGIYVRGGSATIERSTISGNTASATGGGIDVQLASATISDSTVSGNQTTGSDSKGGGVYLLYGAIQMVRSTVAANVTPFWGALYADGAETAITVAGSALANPGRDCGGVILSGGYNRIQQTSCLLGQTGDIQGIGDMVLGPLAANGGPTATHLPGSGSPVVDAIPTGTAGLCTGALTDQRGVTRPRGAGCDAGAVEVGS